jgi:MFS transporter, DHA2 family, metal-tetracycline-proton antiporter
MLASGESRLRINGALLGATMSPLALGVSTTAIALPTISADLSLNGPQAAWVLAAYLLAQSMCVSVFGRLADVRGVRWTLRCGGVLLALGSASAATSNAFAPMVAGRLLQGAGAGALVVSAFSVVGTNFGPADRPKVLGVMTAVIGVVSGSGTLIGGLMTDNVSWRGAIGLPAVAVLFIPAVVRIAPRAPASAGARVDALGASLVAALAAVTVVLLESPSIHFGAPLLVALAVAGILLVLALFLRSRAVADGFLPRSLTSDRRFVLAALAGLTIFAAYVATLFAVPLILTAAHGWSATKIGLVLLPAALVGAAASWFVGVLSTRLDRFKIAAFLAGTSAVAVLLAGLGNGSPVASAIGLALALSGVTGANVSLVSRVPLMVDARFRSVATGLFTLVFQTGGALGSAMVAGLGGPLGDSGALATVAILPACGVVLALAAGTRTGTPDYRASGSELPQTLESSLQYSDR